MVSDSITEAFYAARRSETYPLAVNDVVTVKAGRKSGAVAWVISIQAEAPAVKYLVEYEDGSDEIVLLSALEKKVPIQPPVPTRGNGT
ncbi:MAG TPA: hypothetical protein VFJ90_11425 [Candidatus Didemnitutus sp.]|nr:hypothetical protein [Candidatus Didemnitutus sp.]